MSGADNTGLVRKLIPEPLEQLLYKGRFMTIGDSVFMASVKLSELSTTPGQDNSYELDFKKIGIEFVKGIYSSQSESKPAIVRKLFTTYNFSAEYPIPCNIKEQYQFRVHGEIWNSYNYPIWDWKPVKDSEDVEKKC